MIPGVIINKLKKNIDKRGWLAEVFRKDELDSGIFPEMAYISMTNPGVARGPHEHVRQTDFFCFLGTSRFELSLWDNRPGAKYYRAKEVTVLEEGELVAVVIPCGVVHGYKNTGDKPGMVLNCPNKLYAGEHKKEPVDEVRHENAPESPFKV